MKLSISIFLCMLFVSSAFSAGLIDISYSPYTISQSGSYIVVADLTTGQDLNCITINASDVTIDLNGHTLYGAGTAAGSTGNGVYSGQNNIMVMNGTVRDFRNSGVYLGGGNHQVTRIRAFRNRDDGIVILNFGTIWDNTVFQNGGNGIAAYYGCTITGNSASYNSSTGIYTWGYCIITGNVASLNRYNGITAAIYGCTINGNQCTWNTNAGISISDDSLVTGNNLSTQQDTTNGYGIYVYGQRNRIDSNHIVNNRIGIYFAFSTTNWYGRNSFSGNTAANVSGTAPPAPGSPYTNIFF